MVVVDDEHGGREWNIHAALNIERARVAARRQLYITRFSLFPFSFITTFTMAHREGISSQPHDWCMIPAGQLMKQQQVITMYGNL